MESQLNTKYQNPLGYLKLFFRRKWLFVTPIYISIILGICLIFVLPPTYQAQTMILVEEQRTINPLIQDLAVATSFSQRLRTIREQILSWNNLTDLIKKLDLAKKVRNQLDYELLVKDLRKEIDVQLVSENIIKISYESNDPQQTYLVVKTLTDIFIQENMRSVTKETDVAIDFLKEQLQVYKRKIKESEIADLQTQYDKLALDSTPEHPLVKEIKQKLDSAKSELDSGEYKVDGQEKPVSSTVREVLKKELAKITEQDDASSIGLSTAPGNNSGNANLYKLFLMDKLDATMARDMQVNEQIYNMLLQRLETAKITQRLEASKQGTRYNIVDPARLPVSSKKTKILVFVACLFMGIALGAGLVFMSEFLDQSFLDIEDAKQNLQLPVLGAISRITTDKEIKHIRREFSLRMFIGVALGVLLISLSIAYSLVHKP